MFSYVRSLLSDPKSTIIFFLLALPGRILAICAHEYAHAFVADKCGDPTARYSGRLTIDPTKHLDPLGLLMMLLLGFGWARPVPVNPRNFRHARRDDILVSLAGITMNLLLFLVGGLIACFIYIEIQLHPGCSQLFQYLYEVFYYFWVVNISLAFFNLIPVPPLDGYHVLNDLVLHRPLFASEKAARIATSILFVLMFTGILGKVMSIVVTFFLRTSAGWFFSLFDWIGVY